MTYEDYLDTVVEEGVRYPTHRRGQMLFNVLHEHRPDLSGQVRGTALDPFYTDAKVDTFLEFVERNWTVPDGTAR